MHERLAVAARLFDPLFVMSTEVPSFLIWGHSFVKRLKRDLRSHFDPRADINFKLKGTASVHLHGVGGRTVVKLKSFDLHVAEQIAPDVVILEIGTNDLVGTSPEVVGSAIESLVCLLLEDYKVRVVCVCHVIPRGQSYVEAASFAGRVEIPQQYLQVVLFPISSVFCWLHKAFSHPGKDFYLQDGVHVNPAGLALPVIAFTSHSLTFRS